MEEKKYYLLVSNQDWADEHNVPALCVMDEDQFEKWSNTRLAIYARLGNGGDDFMENCQGETGKQLIADGVVSKTLVTEEFKKTFDKAELKYLSLSSIFDGDEFEEDEDEFEEEEENE